MAAISRPILQPEITVPVGSNHNVGGGGGGGGAVFPPPTPKNGG